MNVRKYGVFCSITALLLSIAIGFTVLSPVSVHATSETLSETAPSGTVTEAESTAEPPTTTQEEITTEVESTAEPPTTTQEETTTEAESTAEPPTTTQEETTTEIESTTEAPTTEVPTTESPTIETPTVDNEPVLDNEYGVIQNKIDCLLDELGVREGKTVYFTVNQSACAGWRKNGHGCSKCDVENIVEAAWFKEIFGDVSTKLFPPHAGAGYMETNTGRSCFGFACFAQWYTFADAPDEKIDAECVAVVKFNKDDMMKNVKPGDVLRIDNSHSMLVYSVEEDGIVVVDSNWNIGGQLNCVVQKHMLMYDSSYKNDVTCVYRAVEVEAEAEAEGRWVQTDDGKWYYVNTDNGNIITGWVGSEESGLWYYMDVSEGYMLSDCWLCDPDSGRWYYLDVNGAMCTSWIVVGDIWYYLDVNGAMCTGWNIINDKWYFFGANGAMLTGWQEIGGKFYYMTENGDCLIDTTTPDGYRVDENGARID